MKNNDSPQKVYDLFIAIIFHLRRVTQKTSVPVVNQ